MKKLLPLILAPVACAASAAVKLPMAFADHAVLQRDRPIIVWGWADPGEAVQVEFAGATAEAIADANGDWQVELPPCEASKEAREMKVSGSNEIVLQDILVGDVWLCSGQSNMEMKVGAARDRNESQAEAEKYPFIRQMKVVGEGVFNPWKDTTGTRWTVCNRYSSADFTATGYFFALDLAKELDIPIGLVNSSWSGQKIEPFISPDGFYGVPELKSIADKIRAIDPATEEGRTANERALESFRKWMADAEKAVAEGRRPFPPPALPKITSDNYPCSSFYNRIYPMTRFQVRGAVWYQGCANGGEGDTYFYKMKALIEGWRALWGYDFPFYFVQLANFQQPTNDPAGGNGWARLREAQRRSLEIPGTGMAVIIDIGEAGDIHPKNKQDVGHRLALWALAKTYGREGLVYSGPLFKSAEVEGGAIRVSFEDFSIGSGLMAGIKDGRNPTVEDPDGKLKGFAVAGEDKQWHWADAVIDGATLLVSSPDVPAPVAVRYAFRQNPAGNANLYNREGLPASPFRSDAW